MMKKSIGIICLSALIFTFSSSLSLAINEKVEQAINLSAKDINDVIINREHLNAIGITYYDDEGNLHIGLKEKFLKDIQNKENFLFELEKVKYSFNDLKHIFSEIESIIDEYNENNKIKTIELYEKEQKILINSEELSEKLKNFLSTKFKDIIIFETNGDRPILENFLDVSTKDWYFNSIQFLANKNYIKGYLDKNFYPNNYITREEAANIAYKVALTPVMENKKIENKNNFKDIEKNRWSYEAIDFLYSKDIVKGKTNNKFYPSENMTREEAAVLTSRILDYRNIPRMENNNSSLIFNDHKEISNWALKEIEVLKRNSLLKGYMDNNFKPKNKITRAEFCEMMVNLLRRIESLNNI